MGELAQLEKSQLRFRVGGNWKTANTLVLLPQSNAHFSWGGGKRRLLMVIKRNLLFFFFNREGGSVRTVTAEFQEHCISL